MAVLFFDQFVMDRCFVVIGNFDELPRRGGMEVD